MSRFGAIATNISLIIGALLLLAIAIEGTTRVFGLWQVPDYAAADWFDRSKIESVPYVMRPGLNRRWGLGGVTTNDDGLRADRTYPPKAAGTLRILALGDSVTFGFGVDQVDSFPHQLELLLNGAFAQAKTVEVINAGINGFNLADEARYLPFLVRRYEPNIVIWTVIANDYDDSFAVDASGVVNWTAGEYVANADHLWLGLGQDPSKPIDMEDFRRGMLPASVAWAEGRARAPNRAHEWLKSHLWSYAWALRALSNLGQNASVVPSAGSNQVPPQDAWTAPDGRRHVFPRSSIYSLQSRVRDYNRLLAASRKMSEEMRVPILLVNTALPLQPENMIQGPFFHYVDAAALLGEPFEDVRQKHNLGWDVHLDPRGNYIFARGILDGLICHGLVAGPADCSKLHAAQLVRNDYWRAFAAAQHAYESRFLPYVNFEKFAGFPQIVGGVFPPRHFPVAPGHRAVLLMARPPGDHIHLDMKEIPADGFGVLVKVTVGSSVTEREAILTPEKPAVEIDLGEALLRQSSAHLLEVEIFCTTPERGQARLMFIGSR